MSVVSTASCSIGGGDNEDDDGDDNDTCRPATAPDKRLKPELLPKKKYKQLAGTLHMDCTCMYIYYNIGSALTFRLAF